MDPAEQSNSPENESIEHMFRQYYGLVCSTINRYIRDKVKTEDIAQDMFAELWSKKDHLLIHTSVPAYLRRMAISRTLNYIRDSKKHNWDELEPPETGISYGTVEPDALLQLEESDMGKAIEQGIALLPEKCRIIFLMSRMEELTYAEIAGNLSISIKTVENQIGKALKFLRLHIAARRGE